MLGLLGRIVELEETDAGPPDKTFGIKFTPSAILPHRGPAPAWLKDQTLTVTRTVVDVSEAGRVGDSIILSGPESAKWLNPLRVTPEHTTGDIPTTIEGHLSWWKDETPPDVTVRAAGRTISAKWVGSVAKGFTATVDLSSISHLPTPLSIDVECAGAIATCCVVPDRSSAVVKCVVDGARVLQIENAWYRIDLTRDSHAGGIVHLVEKSRDLDHFAVPTDRMMPTLDFIGHYDRYRTGRDWPEGIPKTALKSLGCRREADGYTVSMDAVYDEGIGLSTSARYTVFDTIPLMLTTRDYYRRKPKEEKPPEGPPKEAIESSTSISINFRSAALAERGTDHGSRVFAPSGDKLAVVRSAQIHDSTTCGDLKLEDGWVLAEHPVRRSFLLYLVDRTRPPTHNVWTGPYEICVEPHWSFQAVLPEEAIGFSMAMAVGETAGVAPEGVWVACRSVIDAGGTQRCAVVARLRKDASTASIALGSQFQRAPLETIFLPGVGRIQYAVASFERAEPGDDLVVSVADIQGR